jgi:hypothetical protein
MAFEFFKKAAPERKPSDVPVQPEIMYLNSGIGVSLVKFSDAMAMASAMSHPIVYRALNKIAESVQQVAWFAEIDPDAAEADRRGKEGVVAALNDVLSNPNPDMTPAQLRYWLAMNFAGYGRAPLRISTSSVEKTKITGIYPLETRLVRAEFDARGGLIRYAYGETQNAQAWPSRAVWARKPDDKGFATQIWRPGLKGYQAAGDSNSALATVGLPAQVMKSLLLRAIQTAEGHPNVRYMVTCDKTLTEPQKAALKAYLNDSHGPSGDEAGRIPILQNAGNIVIHKLDIHSKAPSDDMARLIFMAFGIPIALAGMGGGDGAKFANNYIESRLSFWQDTIIPGYVSPIFQAISRDLCPPGVRISADLESVPALMQGRILSMKEVAGVDFLTTAEKRAMFGFEDVGEIAKPSENKSAASV